MGGTNRATTGRRPALLPELPDGVRPNAFARWMAGRRLTAHDVADMLAVSVKTVYRWRRWPVFPSMAPRRSMAVRIEDLTGGAVPATGWDEEAREYAVELAKTFHVEPDPPPDAPGSPQVTEDGSPAVSAPAAAPRPQRAAGDVGRGFPLCGCGFAHGTGERCGPW